MDIFVVIGKVVVTLLFPLVPVFIGILFSAFLTTWACNGKFNPKETPDHASIFIGAMILVFYLLFLIVFIPNIWWYR